MVDQTDDQGEPNPTLQPPTSDPVVQPARWYYLDGEERIGPMRLPAIRRAVLDGKLTDQTLVWADGMPDWQVAGDVPALVPPHAIRQEHGLAEQSDPARIEDAPPSQEQP